MAASIIRHLWKWKYSKFFRNHSQEYEREEKEGLGGKSDKFGCVCVFGVRGKLSHCSLLVCGWREGGNEQTLPTLGELVTRH